MHILKVVISGVGETVMFRFKDKIKADLGREELEKALFRSGGIVSDPILVEDDFGLSVNIPEHAVLLVQQIDFEKAVIGDANWQFLQQKLGSRELERLNSGATILAPRKGILRSGEG
jgi:hypothetical protein